MQQTQHEIFLSYARKDNSLAPGLPPDAKGWVTALYDHILADHRRFSTEPLQFFFDTQVIADMDDWRHRILGGLRTSKILLVCLSPNYFASPNCRWEWEEYTRRQVHRLMGSESIATIYFAEVPGTNEQANARWLESVTRGNYTDIRPWFPAGVAALQQKEVRRRMARLGQSLWDRIQRARRAESAPGNLRRQNPFFVGRSEELRRLHEQLAKGAIGVVTAVHGLGGQGKTELAVAYARAWADSYPAGLWALSAEGKKELLPLIGELAFDRALGFTPNEAEKKDPVLLGRSVLAYLQQFAAAANDKDPRKDAGALLLLDNVSDASLLSAAELATLPQADWLRIVATTRLGPDSLVAQQHSLALVAVDSLAEEDALALVRDHQPARDGRGEAILSPTPEQEAAPRGFGSAVEDAAARELVRELGGFTLAVEQVAIYLGLYPEVTPSAFLLGLKQKGLPSADTLPVRHADVAAQMRTRSKQLALILDATLARLDGPSRMALQFAALLPPDSVPWEWLMALTAARHPGLFAHGANEPDPWLETRRRLIGARLLTGGNQPEIARIHRLVAAHLQALADSRVADELDAWVESRATALSRSQAPPAPWELDALVVTLPAVLAARPTYGLACAAATLSEKVKTYRSLLVAATLLTSSHSVLNRMGRTVPANAALQRDLSMSLTALGKVAAAQGNLAEAKRLLEEAHCILKRIVEAAPANTHWHRDLALLLDNLGDLARAQREFGEAKRIFGEAVCIRKRLVESDPSNAEWQRDFSVALNKAADLATQQGDLGEATRLCDAAYRINQRLAESDPANAEWQRDLSVSLERLGDLARARGDLGESQRVIGKALCIAQRLAASDPGNTQRQRDMSVRLERLSALAMAQGEFGEAKRLLNEALRIRQRLAKADPTNATWQRDLSVALERLGDLGTKQGDLGEAKRLFCEAHRIHKGLAQPDPASAVWQRDQGVFHYKMACLAGLGGDQAGRAAELRECYRVLEGMKQHNLYFDQQMKTLYQQLAAMFGPTQS